MNPTTQTILHDPANDLHGNCLSAVIASLLHIPIEDVPIFQNPVTWVKELNLWLRPFGLAYCMVEDFECHIHAYGIAGLWHEVSGNSARYAGVPHAVVGKDGIPVFDPHPSNAGLTEITCHGFFIALEPWMHGRTSLTLGLRKDADDQPECDAFTCDLCGIEITDFDGDLFHHTGILNGEVNGHVHVCAACNSRNVLPNINFDQILQAQKLTPESPK